MLCVGLGFAQIPLENHLAAVQHDNRIGVGIREHILDIAVAVVYLMYGHLTERSVIDFQRPNRSPPSRNPLSRYDFA
jgi:hypothetical protein